MADVRLGKRPLRIQCSGRRGHVLHTRSAPDSFSLSVGDWGARHGRSDVVDYKNHLELDVAVQIVVLSDLPTDDKPASGTRPHYP